NTAFDEYFHTADVRRGRGHTGWHDIPRLGVFVWRLESLLVKKATPVKALNCTGRFERYTFDPTGREIPLFAMADPPTSRDWVWPEPHQVPGPISASLLVAAFDDLYSRALGIYNPLGNGYVLVSPIARDPHGLNPVAANHDPWIDAATGRFFVWPL